MSNRRSHRRPRPTKPRDAVPILEEPLVYDDGSAEGYASSDGGYQVAVRFSLPTDWTEAKIKKAKFNLFTTYAFRVHVYDSDGENEMPGSHLQGDDSENPFENPFIYDPPREDGPWKEIDLSPYKIIVTRDFYIALEHIENLQPKIGQDTSGPISSRTYHRNPPSTIPSEWILNDHRNVMIRALVTNDTA